MLFLEEPQSKSLPVCFFRKDRYNWATTTRSILTTVPCQPDPSFQILPASPVRTRLAKPCDSSLLFSETWALKHIVPLGQGCQKGKNPLDCRSEAVSWLLPVIRKRLCFALHELPEYSCPCQTPLISGHSVCVCLLTLTSLLMTQLRFISSLCGSRCFLWM